MTKDWQLKLTGGVSDVGERLMIVKLKQYRDGTLVNEVARTIPLSEYPKLSEQLVETLSTVQNLLS